MNQELRFIHSSQAGVTLLLSLLILSAITAISFSLATIVFIEARASSDLQRTEPAIYGTLAVLEDASFDIKRGAGNPPSSQINCIAAGICVNMQSTVSSYRDVSITETINPSSTTYINTQNVYYLINPDDLYTDNDMNGSPDGGYGKIRVTNTGSVPIRASLCKLTVNDCISGGGTWDFDTVLNPGASAQQDVSVDSFMPTSAYVLYVLYAGGGSTIGYAKIDTFGPDGSTPKGIAYFSEKLLDVSATYLGVTRRYRALIPKQ